MADTMMPATTRELADFIVRTRFADLPEAVRRTGDQIHGAGVAGLAGSVCPRADGPLLAP